MNDNDNDNENENENHKKNDNDEKKIDDNDNQLLNDLEEDDIDVFAMTLEEKRNKLDEVLERVDVTQKVGQESMQNKDYQTAVEYLNDCKTELNKYVKNLYDHDTIDRSGQSFSIDINQCNSQQKSAIAVIFCNLTICLGMFLVCPFSFVFIFILFHRVLWLFVVMIIIFVVLFSFCFVLLWKFRILEINQSCLLCIVLIFSLGCKFCW